MKIKIGATALMAPLFVVAPWQVLWRLNHLAVASSQVFHRWGLCDLLSVTAFVLGAVLLEYGRSGLGR